MLHKIQEDADAQFGGGHKPEHGSRPTNSGSGSEHAFSGSSSSSSTSPSTRTNIETTTQMTTLVQKESYVRTQTGLYFALYLTFSMGMLGTVLATNLIEFYVFFRADAGSSLFHGSILRIRCKTKNSSNVLLLDTCWCCDSTLRPSGDGLFCRRI